MLSTPQWWKAAPCSSVWGQPLQHLVGYVPAPSKRQGIKGVHLVADTVAGAVECWLLEVESAIKGTLHKLAGDALAAYARIPRSQWILQWAGQLVLNCSQVGRSSHGLGLMLDVLAIVQQQVAH